MKELITIQPDGKRETASFKRVSLSDLQSRVGGLIESVPGFFYEGQRVQYWVNEKGLLLRLPYNPIASNILGCKIVGPLVIERKVK